MSLAILRPAPTLILSDRVIAFTVPGEPVGKGRPRFVRATGRTFTPAKTESYEGQIKLFASRAMADAEPLQGPLRMTIRATYLIPPSWSKKKRDGAKWKTSKPDADNLGKIVADALNKIAYADDAQIAEITVQKMFGPIAALTVTVEELEAA